MWELTLSRVCFPQNKVRVMKELIKPAVDWRKTPTKYQATTAASQA